MMTPSKLRARIGNNFPPAATRWSQATDEVRDMARCAREVLQLGDEHAIDFSNLRTPSSWNTVGINGIISFYERMDQQQRDLFLKQVGAWL